MKNFLVIKNKPIINAFYSLFVVLTFVYIYYQLITSFSLNIKIMEIVYPYLKKSSAQIILYTLFPLAQIIFLSFFFLIHKKINNNINFIGNFKISLLIKGLIVLTILYLVIVTINIYLKIPQEEHMKNIYDKKLLIPYFIWLLLFAPIIEELFFRHFLLSIISFDNKYLITISIILSSTFFTFVHKGQYTYLTTDIWLFSFGIVLSYIRIWSNGIVIPILLHSYTVGCVLLIHRIVYW